MISEHSSKYRNILLTIAALILFFGALYAVWPKLMVQKTDDAAGFKFPEKLSTKYIFTQSWPPKVSVQSKDEKWPSNLYMDENGLIACAETPAESSLPDRVARRLVDDRPYCVEAKSEGAAGSVYTEYAYSTIREGNLVTISFTLRYPQCGNYEAAEKAECEGERETFDLDGVIDRAVQSVRS